MSYTEYFDLFYQAQKADCKYRAFLIDVKNSKKVLAGEKHLVFYRFVDYITEKLCQLNFNRKEQVFLIDENNKVASFYKNPKYMDNLKANPMVLGDGACFFAKNNKLTDQEFLQIVVDGIKKFDIDYQLHFMSGKYQTESYAEGGRLLYKGYMLPILEDLSKKNGILVD